LLGALGISMAAFRLAGGVLLFLIALEMVFEKRTKRRNERAEELQAEEHLQDQAISRQAVNEDIAAFPLAIPFVAGPGAIASVILLMGKAENDWSWQLGIIGVTALVIVVTLAMFLASAKMAHRLPPALINVTTRILGILLAALSIQFLIDGIQQAFGPVAGS
ncbi:MAG: MarC family protein, partial [Granulosicoccaceae bacterium]